MCVTAAELDLEEMPLYLVAGELTDVSGGSVTVTEAERMAILGRQRPALAPDRWSAEISAGAFLLGRRRWYTAHMALLDRLFASNAPHIVELYALSLPRSQRGRLLAICLARIGRNHVIDAVLCDGENCLSLVVTFAYGAMAGQCHVVMVEADIIGAVCTTKSYVAPEALRFLFLDADPVETPAAT